MGDVALESMAVRQRFGDIMQRSRMRFIVWPKPNAHAGVVSDDEENSHQEAHDACDPDGPRPAALPIAQLLQKAVRGRKRHEHRRVSQRRSLRASPTHGSPGTNGVVSCYVG